MRKRVSFYIDGFNVYHRLNARRRYWKYKWLNLARLAGCFVSGKQELTDVYYFTALASWNADKVARHMAYIAALMNEGVKVVYGKFKKRDMSCPLCSGAYRKHEEKMTDVNIAIRMFGDAAADRYDQAVIVSGDSDLLPLIRALKETFPTKEVGLVIPIDRPAESMKDAADFHMKMKERHLSTCQLPESVTLPDGRQVTRPEGWC